MGRVDPLSGIRQWECDGGYACMATEHIEGCYTGEGDSYAVKGQGVAAIREQLRGAVADLRCREQEIGGLLDALRPFLELDRAIGDEWIDVCENARHHYEALGGQS